MDLIWIALPGFCIWFSILLLPWRPWSVQESFDSDASYTSDLSQLTVLVPARNEQATIAGTLTALSAQGDIHKIILINDQSTDDTVNVADKLSLQNLTIVDGKPLPPGWSGKLWALEQGRQLVDTELILLLDADIRLSPGTIPKLLEKIVKEDLQLVSLMAYLRMEGFWEKLMMPAFIFFFKLLYPFQLSNSGSKLVAAAAGGCILINRQALDDIGGFTSLKNELIDDCALARKFKTKGYRTWIGLTHSAISERCYHSLNTIWEMVTRTAFTQLRHSIILLLVCTILMIAAFILPVVSLYSENPITITLSLMTIAMMFVSYIPTLRYYDLSMLWSFSLPLIGVIYLLMTWSSAIQHWLGQGSSWKERTYSR